MYRCRIYILDSGRILKNEEAVHSWQFTGTLVAVHWWQCTRELSTVHQYSSCSALVPWKPDMAPIGMSSSNVFLYFCVYLYYLYFMCNFVNPSKSPMSMSSCTGQLALWLLDWVSCCLCRQLVFAIHWEHRINLDLFWFDLKWLGKGCQGIGSIDQPALW